MLTFVMDGPLVLERITHFQFGTMMPSGAVHPIIYVIYARNVIYEAAEALTASSASGVSTSSSAPVSVGTSATASW